MAFNPGGVAGSSHGWRRGFPAGTRGEASGPASGPAGAEVIPNYNPQNHSENLYPSIL